MPSGRKCGRPRRSWRGNDKMAVRSEIACEGGAARAIVKNRQTRMIRTMTVSAILGALVAGVAAYTVSPSLWQTAMGLRSGGPEQTADAKPAFEEWPICTMTVAMPDADWAKLDPEFAAGKKAVIAEDWDGAIAVLKSAALRDPRNADIQNYIGYPIGVCARWGRRSDITSRR